MTFFSLYIESSPGKRPFVSPYYIRSYSKVKRPLKNLVEGELLWCTHRVGKSSDVKYTIASYLLRFCDIHSP